MSIFTAYGTVYLVKKRGGVDNGHLYAMKVLKKTNIVQKVKTAEHTKTERQVITESNKSFLLLFFFLVCFWVFCGQNANSLKIL